MNKKIRIKDIISKLFCILFALSVFLMPFHKNVSAQEDVELTIAIWDTKQEPVLRSILDDFEEENPGINVQIELTPWSQYWMKLEVAAQGGQMADVVWMNGPNFIKYASNGVIEPIDDYLTDSDIDLNNYPTGLVELYQYDGKQYGIPKDWDTTAVWYNKEMFDEAGLDYPTSDWTYEEFEEVVAQLTDEEKGVWGTVAGPQTQEIIYSVIPQNDGFIISDDKKESGYDKSEAIEAVERVYSLIEKGYSPDLRVTADTSATELFVSGKVATVYAASYSLPVLIENPDAIEKTGIVEMPSIKKKATSIHGLIYAMNSKTEHKDEAWKLIEYLASAEANNKWAESGVVIPAYEPALETWLQSIEGLDLGAYVNSLDYAFPYPVSANSARWNDYENKIFVEIFEGQKTPRDGMEGLASQMNEALEVE